MSQQSIANKVNDSGMLRPEGERWDRRQIGRILDNPAYVSRAVLGSELVAGNWPPIVDAATWERARAVRDADTRRIALLGATRRGPYLLSGLLYCGHCGRRLVHRAMP